MTHCHSVLPLPLLSARSCEIVSSATEISINVLNAIESQRKLLRATHQRASHLRLHTMDREGFESVRMSVLRAWHIGRLLLDTFQALGQKNLLQRLSSSSSAGGSQIIGKIGRLDPATCC